MASGEQVSAVLVPWFLWDCGEQKALCSSGLWGCAPIWVAMLFLQRRQEERRRRRAQQQELQVAESLGKHPLHNRWALWFFKNDKSKMWQANLRLVTKFSTVEDFWALYTHIQLASKLTSGCDYSLFKDGIEPMWEDNQNKRGGRWLITLAKQQRHTELDRFWLETVRTGSGQRHPPAAALSPAWGPSPLRSSCASSGRCSMSTAMRCAGPSSTSVPRGIRSPSGPGRRRTGRGSPTSGASTRSTWGCRKKWPSGTRRTRTRPPRAVPSRRTNLWCEIGVVGAWGERDPPLPDPTMNGFSSAGSVCAGVGAVRGGLLLGAVPVSPPALGLFPSTGEAAVG
ncbi:eukaryotic translation initiation factor 4E type 1B isoform X7 [Gallus gallus]|uniref:eukaryotic translation initiation factor 4E type 1B isoform X7 n=1 Tax=Gallus gallus TaxID=9031 RepID=UPI001AE89B61|nr:eukaryotic translation initiation factor 4E type 1B isoform X7 [Gallus gallus]